MSTQLRLLQKYSSSKQSNLDDLHMPDKLWSMITDLPLEAKITCKYLNSNNKPSLNNLEKKKRQKKQNSHIYKMFPKNSLFELPYKYTFQVKK